MRPESDYDSSFSNLGLSGTGRTGADHQRRRTENRTMSDQHGGAADGSNKPVIAALIIILALFGVAAALGYPQKGTEMTIGVHHEPQGAILEEAAEKEAAKADHDAGHEGQKHHPPFFMVAPFCLLLGAIAIFPLMHATEHFWESNRNKFIVAGGLGLLTLIYYTFMHGHSLDRHFLGHKVVEPAGGASFNLAWVVIQNAILNDFVPFIVLLFSLYTICGGIRISGDLPAHPATNTMFLAAGAVLASFIGTTGAAMLLIRPVLETNSERKKVAHTIVFFIFIVCNCGGCLLPIGDPPLFLGYLTGVDFLWTLQLWKQWALVNGALLAIYFLWDTLFAYPKETKADIARDETQRSKLRFEGLFPNALLLVGIVLAAALLSPSKKFLNTDWYPWLYLREAVQLALVALSLMIGSARVRKENGFSYGAIVEVAALFVGIFICMQPALQILNVRGADLGVDTPAKYFWATGSLSSVLDNAPTYLVFFEIAKIDPSQLATNEVMNKLLVAISLGAVFMGANTYIGNGPNFMVKTIAEKSGIKMPSFFGYMVYSFGVLIPLFAVITFLFF
jgi:Na+/H+ antiporter NhaD/arsenite permease-like protein